MTALLFKMVVFLFFGTLSLVLAIMAYRRPDFRPSYYAGHGVVLLTLAIGTVVGIVTGLYDAYTLFTILDNYLGVSLG